MYGYESSSSNAPKVNFGLNTGAKITVFEYNAQGGAQGAAQDAFDITVEINGREFKQRFFPVSKVYREGRDANGNQLQGEITDTTSDEYKEAHARDVKRLNSILSDYTKCFVDEQQLKDALSVPINSFKDYVQILERLVKSNPDWNKVPVDVFLQYQWSPRGENDRTYLELPRGTKGIKHGTYVCATKGEGYTRVEASEGVKYEKEGIQHPFARSKWFAESNFSKTVSLGNEPTTELSNNQGTGTAAW